ncbi:MAG: hypothetical protein ACRDKJ_12860 [Actinomycetota bacterium]
MERVRGRPGRLAAAALLFAVLATGCGVEGGTAQDARPSVPASAPPSPRPRREPPVAELRATDGRVLGERGSSCWNFTRGGLCSDTDFLDPSFELPVRATEKVSLSYDRKDDPVSLQIQAYMNPDARTPSDFLDVPSENPAQFSADFGPGAYWLVVHSAWPEGDVAHYFRITVS